MSIVIFSDVHNFIVSLVGSPEEESQLCFWLLLGRPAHVLAACWILALCQVCLIVVPGYGHTTVCMDCFKSFVLNDQTQMFYYLYSNIGSEHFIGLAGSGAASGIGVGAFEFNVSRRCINSGLFFLQLLEKLLEGLWASYPY